MFFLVELVYQTSDYQQRAVFMFGEQAPLLRKSTCKSMYNAPAQCKGNLVKRVTTLVSTCIDVIAIIEVKKQSKGTDLYARRTGLADKQPPFDL